MTDPADLDPVPPDDNPNPTPAEKAKHLAETYKRWADGLTTIKVTFVPKSLLPPASTEPEHLEDFEGEEQ